MRYLKFLLYFFQRRIFRPNIHQQTGENTMKNLVLAAMLVVFASSATLAADTVVLKAKNGDISFNHKAHSDNLKDCTICHGPGKPGKIELDKEKGHALCKDCHTKSAQGPTKCGDCHKKG
jgi:predicted CXXCH cytochrome family protein